MAFRKYHLDMLVSLILFLLTSTKDPFLRALLLVRLHTGDFNLTLSFGKEFEIDRCLYDTDPESRGSLLKDWAVNSDKHLSLNSHGRMLMSEYWYGVLHAHRQ